MLSTNIRSKLVFIRFLRRKLITNKATLKPKINEDVS